MQMIAFVVIILLTENECSNDMMDLLTKLGSSNSIISLKPVCSLKSGSTEGIHLGQSLFTNSNRPQVSALGFQMPQKTTVSTDNLAIFSLPLPQSANEVDFI